METRRFDLWVLCAVAASSALLAVLLDRWLGPSIQVHPIQDPEIARVQSELLTYLMSEFAKLERTEAGSAPGVREIVRSAAADPLATTRVEELIEKLEQSLSRALERAPAASSGSLRQTDTARPMDGEAVRAFCASAAEEFGPDGEPSLIRRKALIELFGLDPGTIYRRFGTPLEAIVTPNGELVWRYEVPGADGRYLQLHFVGGAVMNVFL